MNRKTEKEKEVPLLYRAIVENMAEGVFLIRTRDGMIVYANPAMERIFGHASGELVGKHISAVNAPTDQSPEEIAQKIIQSLKANGVWQGEVQNIKKDGTVFWCRANISTFEHPQHGNIWVSIHQDITERKRAEDALRASEEQTQSLYAAAKRSEQERALLDRVRTAIAHELDLPTILRLVVEAIAETFGYALVSLYLLRDETLVLQHQVGYARIISTIPITQGISGRVARTGQPLLLDDAHADPSFLDAIEDIVSEVCVPLINEGKVIGVLNVESTQGVHLSDADLNLMTALSEHIGIAIGRARLYTQVREDEERYRKFIEHAAEAIFIYNSDTRILQDANPAFLQLLGYTLEEARNLSLYDIVAGERADIDQRYAEIMKKGSAILGERKWRRKDGNLIDVYVTVSTAQQAGYTTLFVLAQDVTERKQAEDNLHRRTDELTALQATLLDISSPHSLPELLNLIVERAANLLGATSGGLYFTEPEQRKVRCVVSYKTKGDFTGTLLDFGVGAAGVVAETGQPLIIDDYSKWAGRAIVYEEKQPFQAVMSVPMLWQGKVSGVIHLLRDDNSKKFTQEELNLLMLFANHAAIAVENARLFSLLDQELTERKRAEKALRESEERNRTLIEQIPAVVYIDRATGDPGHSLYVSPQIETLLGITPDEWLQEDLDLWVNHIHPDDRTRVKAEYLRGFQSGEKFNCEYRMITTDGRLVWIRDQTMTIRDVDDHPSLIQGVMYDITERKQAEESLKESEEKYRKIFNNEIDAICIFDIETKRILDVNNAYLTLYGYTRDEVLQLTTDDISAEPEKTNTAIQKAKAIGDVIIPERNHRKKDGTVFQVELSAGAYTWKGRNVMFAVARDITERKRAENALSLANKELNQKIVEIEKLHLALQEQAIRDPLTGLYNRRYMEEALTREHARAARSKAPLSLVMIDMDDLKKLNDTYGHALGDQAIKMLGDQLMLMTRAEDVVCRYGGDEFLVILYNTDMENASKRVKEWQKKIDSIRISNQNTNLRITFSAGIATYPLHGESIEEVIKAADKALYQKKKPNNSRQSYN